MKFATKMRSNWTRNQMAWIQLAKWLRLTVKLSDIQNMMIFREASHEASSLECAKRCNIIIDLKTVLIKMTIFNKSIKWKTTTTTTKQNQLIPVIFLSFAMASKHLEHGLNANWAHFEYQSDSKNTASQTKTAFNLINNCLNCLCGYFKRNIWLLLCRHRNARLEWFQNLKHAISSRWKLWMSWYFV